ncbi:TPA: DUF3265 domain-containing protein [Vibrio parahaemolyticus]|nr:DUF3265 domain-containing protein [Vibrio parahaemolyticus]HAS6853944.1 DUF3265 domain-containing protein [Vibrio parahaemolyticus]HAS6962142.1 DUF3265 domain-containing protein [Vibrio parahaemolyticus]
MAFLVCVGFCVEVPCGSLVIACFTPKLGVRHLYSMEK